MKRRRLEQEKESCLAHVDGGEIPTDSAALEKCPLIIHSWCDIPNISVFQECEERVKWRDRWRLCSRPSDPDTEPPAWWASIGCLTAESNFESFCEAAWLPPIAALVIKSLLRLSKGYVRVNLLDRTGPLCLIPPEQILPEEKRLPIRLECFTPEPGQLVQIMYLQRTWYSEFENARSELDSSSVFGKVVLTSLTGPEIATNLFLRDCLLSFATPSLGKNRKLLCAFPGDSELLLPFFSAEQDPECQLYVALAKSLIYAWSSIQGGHESLSDKTRSFELYSSLSDEVVDTVPLRMAKQTSNDGLSRELDESENEIGIPLFDEDSFAELPSSALVADGIDQSRRSSRHPAARSRSNLIQIDETPSQSPPESQVIDLADSESSSLSICEITQIKKLKDLTGLFAVHVAETGWGEVLDLVRPFINSICVKTMRFENHELFNDEAEEWRARQKIKNAKSDIQSQHFDKVLLSRLIHLMLYGHMMQYAKPVIDFELTTQQALDHVQHLAEERTRGIQLSSTPPSESRVKSELVVAKAKTDVIPPNSITSSSAPSFESAVSRKCVQQAIESEGLSKKRRSSESSQDQNGWHDASPVLAAEVPSSCQVKSEFDDLFATDPEPSMDLLFASMQPPNIDPPVGSSQSADLFTSVPETDVKDELSAEDVLDNLCIDYQDDESLTDVMQPSCTFYELKQRLYPHQLEAVKWMRRREREGPKLEDGYIVRRCGGSGETSIPAILGSFYDLATACSVPHSKLDKVRGGILGDEMGLGKTIETIVTVLHDPFTIKHFEASQRDGVQFDSCDMRMGCTLILCPVSVINNWKSAVLDFTQIPESVVCVYHGASKARISTTSLAKMLFVITSYQSVVKAGVAAESQNTELHQIHWRRVILDEGHEIRNPRAKKTRAIMKLIYDIGWIVTGTPLQNSMADILPLLQFLKVKHLPIPDPKTALERMPVAPSDAPLAAGTTYEGGAELTTFLRFTFAFRSMILRRTKASVATLHQSSSATPSSDRNVTKISESISEAEISASPICPSDMTLERAPTPLTTKVKSNRSLALPEKTVIEFKVKMDPDEREKYVALKCVTKLLAREAKGQFMMLSTLVNHMRLLTGSELALGPKARRALHEARRIMSREGSSLHDSLTAAQYDLVLQSAAVRELARSENLPQETVCPICYDSNVDCVTQCSHPFHRKCIKEWFDLAKEQSCPYCRKKISDKALLNLRDIKEYAGSQREVADDLENQTAAEPVGLSSKVREVSEKIMVQIREGHPADVVPGPVKIVVFSSFVRMLNILDKALAAKGVETVMFTGGLTRVKRDKIIREFQSADKPLVFLASYGAGATGVTLTAASTVFLLDPWWNPFTEDQAVDRIHRISQVRPVTVYRVIVEDSIEEGVISCQLKKRAMSARVVGGGRQALAKDTGNATARDLESLLVND